MACPAEAFTPLTETEIVGSSAFGDNGIRLVILVSLFHFGVIYANQNTHLESELQLSKRNTFCEIYAM
ncbi:hypothetical protein EL09_22555 [Salmonella enterica subsp. enterica]|nr:hypothetical protein [Salmonella enterica subsp. enterica]